jgi:hypothetical protein
MGVRELDNAKKDELSKMADPNDVTRKESADKMILAYKYYLKDLVSQSRLVDKACKKILEIFK